MMKALVLKGINDFIIEERVEPVVSFGCLKVKIKSVCICGSDFGAILGTNSLFTYPRVLGHEAAGEVVEIGEGVEGFAVGDRVALMPCSPCGKCRACVKGKPNTCKSLKIFGVQQDGALQQFLVAPSSNWLKVPKDMDLNDIAMLEPLAIGAHAVRRLNICDSDRVLVLGAGPIGVTAAENARVLGAKVILADTNEERRNFVSSTFGYKVLNPLSSEYQDKLMELTNGDLFDAVVDTTASKISMENTINCIAFGGRIIFVGICNGVLEFVGKLFHSKEPTLLVSRNSTKKDFEFVLDKVLSRQINPKSFITHTVNFNEAYKEIPKWVNPSYGVFKGVVSFE